MGTDPAGSGVDKSGFLYLENRMERMMELILKGLDKNKMEYTINGWEGKENEIRGIDN